jgi:hypothetical protein
MCRIATAAWPLLAISSLLIVAGVGLHLYQLRIQVSGSSQKDRREALWPTP